MTGRRVGSAAQATDADGRSPAHATRLGGLPPLEHAVGVGGSRPLGRVPSVAGPIDGLRRGGVAFSRSFWRVPLAGSSRPLPGEVTP